MNHYVQTFHLHTSRVETLLSSAYVVDLCSIQGRAMDAAAEGFLSFKLVVNKNDDSLGRFDFLPDLVVEPAVAL